MSGNSAQLEPLAPGVRVNGYQIQGLINSGGFGKVYRALDTDVARLGRRTQEAERRRVLWSRAGYAGRGASPGPRVAIKECAPASFVRRAGGQTQLSVISASRKSSFDWSLARFDNEAAFLTSHVHPAVISAWETFSANGTRYLVMEEVSGPTLERLIEDGGAQDEAAVRAWLRPLLQALRSAETVRVNHLDISPTNILFRNADSDPVLIDFGASRFGALPPRATTYFIVNDGYSAPEKGRHTSRLLDGRCDVYSLAAAALFALTGQAPPSAVEREGGQTLDGVLRRAEHRASPGFLRALEICMAMSATRRPASIAAMEQRLFGDLGALPPDPVAPRPVRMGPVRLPPIERGSRRNAMGVALIAAGLIVLILLTASLGVPG
jgi:serine/threonine protein kinase